ncbi:unnamed protein product [Didymodactylos carnosus]|uniref:Periplasmic binding protein domain-containing protein n=1 Tax=Didymodactylos carnosus TaxID=1234261 RepID=A0A815AU75_9BILA|nr:unnamed protein product [Didymodactylos carnosus]CAF4038222.1 unnamed protein product [Didymodactylos carnosus]
MNSHSHIQKQKTPQQCPNNKVYKIVAVLAIQNKYTRYVGEGMFKAFNSTNCFKTKLAYTNNDPYVEFETVHKFITQKYDGIMIQPVSPESAQYCGLLAKYSSVLFGNLVWIPNFNGKPYFNFVATVDAVKIGNILGGYLIDYVNSGKVIVIQGIIGERFSSVVNQAFLAKINNTGLTVAVNSQGFYDQNITIPVIAQALSGNPDTKAIVTFSGEMGNGVAIYLKQNGIKNIVHISVDCNVELAEYIRENIYVRATAYYSGAQTSLLIGEQLKAKLLSGKANYQNTIQVSLVTKSNLDDILQQDPFEYNAFVNRIPY